MGRALQNIRLGRNKCLFYNEFMLGRVCRTLSQIQYQPYCASPEKLFGVYPHYSLDVTHPLMRGLDDVFNVPQSREWSLSTSDIAKVKDLQIISYSDEAEFILYPTWNAATFMLRATANTTEIRLPKNISEIWIKACLSKNPQTIFRRTISTLCRK